MLSHLFYFCFYSILGWSIDTLYRSLYARRYKPGGFSRYPFSPIYGFAGLGIIWLAPFMRAWPLAGEWAFFAVTFGTYEYLGGVLSQRLFHKRLWNYAKGRPGKLQGYTGPWHASAWGVLAVFVAHVLQPFLEKLLIFPR